MYLPCCKSTFPPLRFRYEFLLQFGSSSKLSSTFLVTFYIFCSNNKAFDIISCTYNRKLMRSNFLSRISERLRVILPFSWLLIFIGKTTNQYKSPWYTRTRTNCYSGQRRRHTKEAKGIQISCTSTSKLTRIILICN